MQEAFKFESNSAMQNLYIQSIVTIGGIPVAGFLSAIDVESFLRSLSDFDLDASTVICTMPSSDHYGESLTGKVYIEDRKSTLSKRVWTL